MALGARKSLCVFSIIAVIILFKGHGEANSFPFRAINIGDPLPPVTLTEYKTNQKISLNSFDDQILLVVFWGADIPTKRQRSVKALKVIKELQPFLKQRDFKVIYANVQGDGPGVIASVMEEAGIDQPVFIDENRKAYGSLGIFVMPAILVIDKQGHVAAGMGYTRELKKRLLGEIQIALGEKTREQFEAELRPEMVEKSDEEKDARRHFNMGMTMIKRGQPESAIREMKKAIENNPEMAKAYIQLGCLSFDEGKMDEAQKALNQGLDRDPDSLEGQICQARIKASRGEVEEALDDLRFLLMRNFRNPDLHFVMGSLYEKLGEAGQAADEFKKAYELLEKKMRLEK